MLLERKELLRGSALRWNFVVRELPSTKRDPSEFAARMRELGNRMSKAQVVSLWDRQRLPQAASETFRSTRSLWIT